MPKNESDELEFQRIAREMAEKRFKRSAQLEEKDLNSKPKTMSQLRPSIQDSVASTKPEKSVPFAKENSVKEFNQSDAPFKVAQDTLNQDQRGVAHKEAAPAPKVQDFEPGQKGFVKDRIKQWNEFHEKSATPPGFAPASGPVAQLRTPQFATPQAPTPIRQQAVPQTPAGAAQKLEPGQEGYVKQMVQMLEEAMQQSGMNQTPAPGTALETPAPQSPTQPEQSATTQKPALKKDAKQALNPLVSWSHDVMKVFRLKNNTEPPKEDFSDKNKEKFLKSIQPDKKDKASTKMDNEMLRSIIDSPKMDLYHVQGDKTHQRTLDLSKMDPQPGTIYLTGEAAERFRNVIGRNSDPNYLYQYAQQLAQSQDEKLIGQTFTYHNAGDKAGLQNFLLKEKSRQLAHELENRASREFKKNKPGQQTEMVDYRAKKIDMHQNYAERFKELANSKDANIAEQFSALNKAYLEERNGMRKGIKDQGIKTDKDFAKRIEKTDKGLKMAEKHGPSFGGQ